MLCSSHSQPPTCRCCCYWASCVHTPGSTSVRASLPPTLTHSAGGKVFLRGRSVSIRFHVSWAVCIGARAPVVLFRHLHLILPIIVDTYMAPLSCTAKDYSADIDIVNHPQLLFNCPWPWPYRSIIIVPISITSWQQQTAAVSIGLNRSFNWTRMWLGEWDSLNPHQMTRPTRPFGL